MTIQRRSRFLRGLFSYAQLLIVSRHGYQMVYALLRELFGHLQRLSLSLHNLDVKTPVTKETPSMEKASTARQSARASVVREHTWDAVARRILGLAGLKSEPKSQPRTVESII